MSKFFRPWKIDEAQLLPASVQDYVPSDHLSRFILALVRENLDLSELIGSYRSELGQPPFDPRMMTALLLTGYASGIYSSRRIAKACEERVDFMMIVAGDAPDVSEEGLPALPAIRMSARSGFRDSASWAAVPSILSVKTIRQAAVLFSFSRRRSFEIGPSSWKGAERVSPFFRPKEISAKSPKSIV